MILLMAGGIGESAADVEAKTWINCVLEDKAPVVLPEQALVVTEILEAIYASNKTGQPVYFEKKPSKPASKGASASKK